MKHTMSIQELLEVVKTIELTPEFVEELRKRLRKLDEEFRIYSESTKVTAELLNRTYNL
ncbi:hypothetical protein vBEnt31_000249 [Enterobacter phage vB_Ent31]|nr:hypothetical protein vBEnt31_000249 [Enterobacter phage vB_Ent31]